MWKEGLTPEGLILDAYSHLHEEIGLDNIKYSLEIEVDGIQKAHDAIHEFLLIAPLLFPDDESISWHSKSAFLVYHWEAFSLAHRSLLEALCANYNAAYILLRSTMELIVKGAFLECMCRKELIENTMTLENDRRGKALKKRIVEILAEDKLIEKRLEKTSGHIFDIIAPIIDDPKYRVPLLSIIGQLSQWKILEPIADPNEVIYNKIFKDLSANVHVIPDKIDIGRRLLTDEGILFKSEVLCQELNSFCQNLLELMDIAIIIELNVLADLIKINHQPRSKLYERLSYLEQLNLRYSIERLRTLTKSS
ncbi:MAG: hypothetical protein BWY21_02066 [Parcubacteria group bacterium ADurb.Bin216]|nr:MAG: hypothetical protein BWY21_02066 [Parcubacteria group bacterium ADurb.Bin216]